MKHFLWMVLLLQLLFLHACRETAKEQAVTAADQNSTQDLITEQVVSDTASAGLPAPVPAEQEPGQQQPQPPAQPEKPDWDKKIIRTAHITARVTDSKKFSAFLKEKIKQQGGYISSEEQTQSGDRISSTVVLKVPVDRFDETLRTLEQEAGFLDEKRITAEDVTKEYVDVRSRLETKKQMRIRYLELLKQARSMEEILQVQAEINRIQEELESVTARMNYLATEAAMSTINLTFYQVVPGGGADDAPGFWLRIREAFFSGWEGIGSLVIALVHLWPLVIGAGVAVFLIGKWKGSRRKKSQAPLHS
jgi:hypothetical protein